MKTILIILTTVFALSAEQECHGKRVTDWVKFDKTGSEYRFHCPSNYVEWEEAERRCQRYRPTAHLVSIHSEEENDFVRKLIGDRNGNFDTYIGLTREAGQSSNWKWTDGSTVDFEHWYLEDPSNNNNERIYERCSMMLISRPGDKDKRWRNFYCHNGSARSFVCKRGPSKEGKKKPTEMGNL
ncbi:lectin C-type domain protein [Ancylostoma ceylanicum]|uniref:Lectin C-type domain protein n=2 Tax=Ancylostoma ceylanicum TaxID=53326 RepID=A0A0D6MBZ7_9BILA|nr:lectin C-type domain protein [Ancylostoma ceylanicum]EYC31480.1 hypothetical protein Y032_0004g2177 [Ancylostoma ceylanicum]